MAEADPELARELATLSPSQRAEVAAEIALRAQARSESLLTREEPIDSPMAEVPDEVPLQLEVRRGTEIRAERVGTEVRIELSGVNDAAWEHLRRFLAALQAH